jgi:hypothetical protein
VQASKKRPSQCHVSDIEPTARLTDVWSFEYFLSSIDVRALEIFVVMSAFSGKNRKIRRPQGFSLLLNDHECDPAAEINSAFMSCWVVPFLSLLMESSPARMPPVSIASRSARNSNSASLLTSCTRERCSRAVLSQLRSRDGTNCLLGCSLVSHIRFHSTHGASEYRILEQAPQNSVGISRL